MCVVICKEKDQKKPTKDMLQKAWESNPDGAGFMLNKNGVVVIRKGFMTFKDFWAACKDLPEKSAIVYHFRIATHGARDERGTHPFPITSDETLLQQNNVITNIGIAHNGIISLTSNYPVEANPSNLSDTQLYVRDYLARINKINKGWYRDTFWLNVVDRTLNSKMAVLLPTGEIIKFGSFVDVRGYSCSNSFFDYTKTYSKYYGSIYDDYYNYEDEFDYLYPSTNTKSRIFISEDLPFLLYDYSDETWHTLYEYKTVEMTETGVLIDGIYNPNIGIISADDTDGVELTYEEVLSIKNSCFKKEENKNE